MILSFTVIFGAKYLTGMVTSVPPYETFSFVKNNILHQSKNYKNHFENSKFWGMNTSNHTCQIFCSKSNCETMYHWFFLLEISVAKIMINLNVCSAHSYLCTWSRFNPKNCYGRNCVFIWYVSHMLLIRWNSDKDIWVGGQLISSPNA